MPPIDARAARRAPEPGGPPVRSDDGLVLFFEAHEDLDIPPHAHGAQWGVLIKGALTLVMDGVTHEIRPGQTYSIPAGCVHSAKLAAGSVAMDVFEEADRYEIDR